MKGKMQMLFNIDEAEASKSHDRRETINGLKDVGYYEVKPEKVQLLTPEGKTPYLSFWLRIEGMLDDKKAPKTKKDGTRVYKNSMLFYRAFISPSALFSLEDILVAMGEDGPFGGDLAAKLNSFPTEAKLLAWINTWLDTDNTYVVYVNHDLKAEVPSEKVHWQAREVTGDTK